VLPVNYVEIRTIASFQTSDEDAGRVSADGAAADKQRICGWDGA